MTKRRYQNAILKKSLSLKIRKKPSGLFESSKLTPTACLVFWVITYKIIMLTGRLKHKEKKGPVSSFDLSLNNGNHNPNWVYFRVMKAGLD